MELLILVFIMGRYRLADVCRRRCQSGYFEHGDHNQKITEYFKDCNFQIRISQVSKSGSNGEKFDPRLMSGKEARFRQLLLK